MVIVWKIEGIELQREDRDAERRKGR